ncbi:MAG TPA: cell wall hydrolase [Croceibacterium sp.]|nr:cell wall hydrolase [Croceibacterium sp.]
MGATLRQARARIGAKIAALAAAITVPAMATPVDWSQFGGESAPATTPMPFEQPGASFPGSAFYYLADEPYAPLPATAQIHSDTDIPAPALDAAPLTGGARPLIARGTTLDKGRALQCLTQAIYYEAASEPDAGQRAVAQVVLNRVAHPAYPNTVCGVVYQGSERRTGCQFTFTCDGSLARKPVLAFWDRAQRVALAALSGAVYRPVGLATHYHTVQVHPYWAASLDRIGTIGAHIFYRWRGAAGRPAAFQFAYAGGEPLPAPHLRSLGDDIPLDPVAVARAYEATHPVEAVQAALVQIRATAPAPAYSQNVAANGGDAQFTGERLPASGSVKPEFAQSGQWIARP